MSLPLLPLWEVLVEAAEEALNQYQEVLISLPQICALEKINIVSYSNET